MQHSWTNLTCDQNTCQLIMNDGSSPPIPIPLDIHPSNNVSTYSKYNIRSKSPTSIALTTISIIIGICFLILLAKIISRNPKLSSLFGCCFVSKTTRTRSRPPSYQVVHQPMIEILPSYDQQEPSPPKYEQAIVTQIRGHHPYSETAASTSSSAATPIWIPVYINHDQPTNRTTISSPMFRTFLTSNDWATIRHHPPPESLRSFSMIEQVSDNEDAEERRRR
jgi:hypothetical protein